jgi:hypothetical protein
VKGGDVSLMSSAITLTGCQYLLHKTVYYRTRVVALAEITIAFGSASATLGLKPFAHRSIGQNRLFGTFLRVIHERQIPG